MNKLLNLSHRSHNFADLILRNINFILIQNNEILDNFIRLFNSKLNIQIMPHSDHNIAINSLSLTVDTLAISNIDEYIGSQIGLCVDEE